MTRVSHRIGLVFLLLAAAVSPLAAAQAAFDELLPQIAAFDYGQDAAPLDTAAELLAQAQNDLPRLREMTARLAGLLTGETTDAAKLFICRQVYLYGNEDCLRYVAPLLLRKETVDMACYALGRMAGQRVVGAMISCLIKSEDNDVKSTLINTLGQRRDERAVSEIVAAIKENGGAVVKPAVLALGTIGSPEAVAALMALWGKDPQAVEEAVIDGVPQLAARGGEELNKAVMFYEVMQECTESETTRATVIKALAVLKAQNPQTAPDAVAAVIEGLKSDSRVGRTAAAEALREIPEDALAACADQMAGLPPAAQVMLITALADRNVRAALPAVTALAASNDAAVRLATIDALARLGDASTVPVLALLAAGPDADAAKAARKSLARLSGPDINAAMAAALKAGDVGPREQLAVAVSDRMARDLAPVMLELAAAPEESLRKEAFQTLARIGREQDLPALIDLLVKETADGPRAQAENAAIAVARRVADPKTRSAAALAALPAMQGNASARAALVRVLGKLGDTTALDPLRAELDSPDPQLREAAIRSLMEWPTPAPADDLLRAAQAGDDETLKKLALRGYLRLAALPSDRPADQTVAMFERGLQLSSDPAEKILALSSLAEYPSKAAADLIRRYENDAQVSAEAKLALEKVNDPKMFVTASEAPGEAGNAIDGDPDTRWTTGTNQAPKQWYQIDLGWPAEVTKVVLDCTGSDSDYPKGYEVYVSTNPEDWGEPVAKGKGDNPVMNIACTPKSGRYVRIVQTNSKEGLWWSIHELKIEKRVQ